MGNEDGSDVRKGYRRCILADYAILISFVSSIWMGHVRLRDDDCIRKREEY